MAANEALDDAVYAPCLPRLRGELAARAKDREPLTPESTARTAPNRAEQVYSKLTAAGGPCAPIYAIDQMFEDP